MESGCLIFVEIFLTELIESLRCACPSIQRPMIFDLHLSGLCNFCGHSGELDRLWSNRKHILRGKRVLMYIVYFHEFLRCGMQNIRTPARSL